MKKQDMNRDWIATARTLSEALPYLQRYTEAIVVIKLGGHAMTSDQGMETFARDVALMRQVGINPIICLLYTSPSPRDRSLSRMPSSA